MLDDVSRIHFAGTAFKFADVAFTVEQITKNLKRQFAALDGLLEKYRNRNGHIHAH